MDPGTDELERSGRLPEAPSPAQVFWDNRIRENPNASGTGCANFGLHYNRWLYRLRAHRFGQLMSTLPVNPRQARVLDIGSGTGFYIDLWQRQGACSVEGLDFSASAVAMLGSKFPGVSFHFTDISNPDLRLPAESFDIISAFDILFHIVNDENYARALNNISRLLKPGGLLIFSENFVHKEHPRIGDYHYSRSIGQIQRHLDDAGMQMLFRRPMFVLMNAPDDSTGRLQRAWWRLVTASVQQGEIAGWVTGAVLYPLERFLTTVMKESPSTEIAVCRRGGSVN